MGADRPKIRVGVIFGGRSAEHEVSLASGAGIMNALDPQRYEVRPILVTREGAWKLLPAPAAPPEEGEDILLPAQPSEKALLLPERGARLRIDVFFPIIHGTYGEDGTLQGLLELAEIPFVGAGCLSSALAMDKVAAKAVFRAAGLPVLPALSATKRQWESRREDILGEVIEKIGVPFFVKASSLGSSVGVHRIEAADDERIDWAVQDALAHDLKVMFEEEARGREFECAILENPRDGSLLASPLAEIRPKSGWYDYEAKYTPGRTDIIIPASLPEEVAERVRDLSRKAFTALQCAGLARVDFFYRENSGELLINELNTLPGFTPLSGYPMMIQAAGLSYPEMLDRLIECALARAERVRQRDFHRLK